MRFWFYIRKGFSKKNIINMIVSFAIAFLLGLIVALVQHSRYPLQSNKYIASDFFVVFGIINCVYALVVILMHAGFGAAIFKYHKNRRGDVLKDKIEKEKLAPKTPEQKIRLKNAQKRYENHKRKQDLKESKDHNNIAYYLLMIIGILAIVIAILLVYA